MTSPLSVQLRTATTVTQTGCGINGFAHDVGLNVLRYYVLRVSAFVAITVTWPYVGLNDIAKNLIGTFYGPFLASLMTA